MIYTLTKIELEKIFRKIRSYIGFLAILALTMIVQIAIYVDGEKMISHNLQSVKDSFLFVGNLINGYLIGNILLQGLFLQIPFLIVLVGGDLFAGEATAGTYRMLLTRPVSRLQIAASKFIAGFIYTNMLIAFLALTSLGLSILIFGRGELLVIKDIVYIFAEDDVLWRFILSYGYAVLSMTTVLALSYLFSSLVENAIGPIVATMAVIIVFLIISAFQLEILQNVKPFLFTYHMSRWREFMSDPVDYWKVINSGLVLFVHIIGLTGITYYLFKKKDILT